MLIVKGLDVIHRDAVAKAATEKHAPTLTTFASVVAFLGAVFLIYATDQQIKSTPQASAFPSYGNP